MIARAKALLAEGRHKAFFRLVLAAERASETRDISRALWQQAIPHFWSRGDWRLRAHIYQRYAAHDWQFRTILDGYDYRAPRRLRAGGADDIRRRVDQALTRHERAPTMPVGHTVWSSRADRPLASFFGTRILFFLQLRLPNGIPFVAPRVFYDTALQLGLSVEMIALDDEAKIGPDAYRCRVIGEIEKFKPHLVFIENNNPTDGRAFSAGFVREIKSRFGVVFCVVITDAHHRAKHSAKFEYWCRDADRIIYHEPNFQIADSESGRAFLAPPICDETIFHDAGRPRDIAVSFLGAYKYSRSCWVAAVANAAVGLHIPREVGGQPVPLGGYVDIMQRSRAALSFGAREPGCYIVTGRSWEIIECGTLLLEEEGSRIDNFFLPYVHYIPFSSANDLIDKCLFIQHYPEEAAAVAARGTAFNKQWYGVRRFWTRFLNSFQQFAEKPSP